MKMGCGWRRVAAIAGLLAIMAQLLATIVAGPALAAGDSGTSRVGIPLCHTETSGQPANQRGDGKPAPCAACPFCQLLHRSPVLFPGTPVSFRPFVFSTPVDYRSAIAAAIGERTVAEAAAPRGPPSI